MFKRLMTSALVIVAGLLPLRTSGASPATVGAVRCSTYTVPGLDVAPVAVSTMTEGVPYVLVCTDQAGHELVNQIIIFG